MVELWIAVNVGAAPYDSWIRNPDPPMNKDAKNNIENLFFKISNM